MTMMPEIFKRYFAQNGDCIPHNNDISYWLEYYCLAYSEWRLPMSNAEPLILLWVLTPQGKALLNDPLHQYMIEAFGWPGGDW